MNLKTREIMLGLVPILVIMALSIIMVAPPVFAHVPPQAFAHMHHYFPSTTTTLLGPVGGGHGIS